MREDKIISLVSLGMSCQTTHQLRRLTNLQPKAVNTSPRFTAPSGLFDWLICPPASTIRLLNQRIPDFSKSSIAIRKGRVYWEEFNLYFWHNFLVSDHQSRRVSIDATFEQEIVRWRYLRDRFSALDPARTLFVVSNTQNNLQEEVFDESEHAEYHFTDTLLDSLEQSLARYFCTTTNDIHLQVVTRKGRSRGLDDAALVTFLPLDHNEWKGSNQSWDQWWQLLTAPQHE